MRAAHPHEGEEREVSQPREDDSQSPGTVITNQSYVDRVNEGMYDQGQGCQIGTDFPPNLRLGFPD